MKMIQALNLKRKLLNQVCDYSEAYILITGDITARDGNADTKVAFKSCAPFARCVTHINDEHIDTAESLDIVMNMYNLIEYSYNYSITSGTLWQFIQHDQNMNNGNPSDLTNSSISFKYKPSILGSPAVGNNGLLKNAKIVTPLRYSSNFFRSLEMPLINCKIHLELNWTKNYVTSNIAGATTFKITDTKLHVPTVTLSTKDNANLAKQLNEGFKRPVYWNEYKTKIE